MHTECLLSNTFFFLLQSNKQDPTMRAAKQMIRDAEQRANTKLLDQRRAFNRAAVRGGMRLSITLPSTLCDHTNFMEGVDVTKCTKMRAGATSDEVMMCEDTVHKIVPRDAAKDLGVLSPTTVLRLNEDPELRPYIEIGSYFDCCYIGEPRVCNDAPRIKRSVTLFDAANNLMKQKFRHKRYRDGDSVYENSNELEAVELQILHALDKLNTRHKVLHNDVHWENLLVQERDRVTSLDLSIRGRPIKVLSRYIPVLIDWDYASTRYVETSNSGMINRMRKLFDADKVDIDLRDVEYADMITYLARLNDGAPSRFMYFASKFGALPPLKTPDALVEDGIERKYLGATPSPPPNDREMTPTMKMPGLDLPSPVPFS